MIDIHNNERAALNISNNSDCSDKLPTLMFLVRTVGASGFCSLGSPLLHYLVVHRGDEVQSKYKPMLKVLPNICGVMYSHNSSTACLTLYSVYYLTSHIIGSSSSSTNFIPQRARTSTNSLLIPNPTILSPLATVLDRCTFIENEN
ncbi:Hypothetical predicted protein [Octopus vulgaris]|uniref:Uncharacterized protein n=1 Tax=Octopus vulgaris TaxID=6645 RepID=A0AA36B2Q1_OCTVU|nr:Hypothetical predicted protein [Octopus vulgaris]